MLHYCLQRISDNGKSTSGILFLQHPSGPEFKGYTLEDEHRDVKVQGETRIPAGIYTLAVRNEMTGKTEDYRARFPGWFTWHIQLLDVPGFSSIYIHIGNYERNTDGCILLGDSQKNNTVVEGFIGESTECFRRFYTDLMPQLVAGQQAQIDVRDEISLINIR